MYGLLYIVYGLWFVVYGLWFIVYGVLFIVYCMDYYLLFRFMVSGVPLMFMI